MPQGKTCGCMHHKVMPLFIILVGLTWLLTELTVISLHVAIIVWAVLIILAGLFKLMGGACGCCDKK